MGWNENKNRQGPGKEKVLARPAAWLRRIVFLALALILIPEGVVAADNRVACRDRAHHIIVRVMNLHSAKGLVTAVLYGDNPATFLKKGARLAKERMPAATGVTEVCLPAPGPGRYAVVAYHDENGNRKFDKSWIGLPIEGYGVSRDPTIFLGPPSFEASAFAVGAGATTIVIKINY